MRAREAERGEATWTIARVVAWATLALSAFIAGCTADPSPSDAGACSEGRSVCDGMCLDTSSDPRHCGHCDQRCATGEGCVGGLCVDCPSGFADCDGDRANGCEVATETDPHNCGWCSHGCPAGIACVRGSCACPDGLVACAARCVDVSSDTQNCGACDHACPSRGSCAGGSCACPDGLVACGARCVDVSSDAESCGACGRTCRSGETCAGGACACPSPRVACGERCVDLSSDARSCGACERQCDPGQPCVGGHCVATCQYGTSCDGFCVDLGTSMSNCGACGHRCDLSERCESGVCVGCPMGSARCGDICNDVTSNRDHCGVCGRRCSASERCEDGRCTPCPAGHLWCGDDVATCGEDSLANRTRCGACGRVCGGGPGYVAACSGGRCAYACVAGAGECDGDARRHCETSIESDDAHCGACGAACEAGTFCVAGRCVARPIRPLAPTSTLYLTRARPWLFWELPPGADGARVELCPTRACDSVEASWDVTGSRWRVPTSLTPGVHFWRLFARNGARVDTTPGPSWELVVPVVGAPPAGEIRALLDVNGDGIEDRVTPRNERDARGAPRWSLEVFFGGSASTTPDQTLVGDELEAWEHGFDWSSQSATATGVVALGDINGDGYGDVLVRKRANHDHQTAPSTVYDSFEAHDVFVGGPSGLAAAPVDSSRIGDFDYDAPISPDVAAVFPTGDIDGDGYGDWFLRAPGGRGRDYWDVMCFGGRGALDSAGGARHLSERLPLFGDFDADGAADAVFHEERVSFPTTSRSVAAVMPGSPSWSAAVGTPASLSLDPCGGVARPDEYTTVALSVLDADDDGYDDLRATLSLTPPVTMLYLGGPDGLSTSRCRVLR